AGHVEAIKAFGVGQHVDLDDPAAGDGERHHRERLASDRHDDGGGAVDQHGPEPCRGLVEHDRAPGDHRRPAYQPGDVGAGGSGVDPLHDVGVEHADQRVEVAPAGGGEERVDHFALAADVRVGGRYAGTAYPAPRPAGELP